MTTLQSKLPEQANPSNQTYWMLELMFQYLKDWLYNNREAI